MERFIDEDEALAGVDIFTLTVLQTLPPQP
jgi:hypothetical protein